jgi:hypothetical protein
MTPEGKIKQWVTKYLKDSLPEVVLYRPLGGPFGKAGEPDLHVTLGGCKGVIEAKVDGEDPTPLQQKRLRDYAKAGALCMVLRGKDIDRLNLFIRLMRERAECLKELIKLQNQG